MCSALMTADEVARVLAVSEGWVNEQSRTGRIPTVRLGRYRRYRREAIEEWLRDVEQLSTPTTRRAIASPCGSTRRPTAGAARSSAWRLTLSSTAVAPVSGHVRLRRGKRRNVFYVKFRLPDGRQVVRKLGPEWRQRGRPR